MNTYTHTDTHRQTYIHTDTHRHTHTDTLYFVLLFLSIYFCWHKTLHFELESAFYTYWYVIWRVHLWVVCDVNNSFVSGMWGEGYTSPNLNTLTTETNIYIYLNTLFCKGSNNHVTNIHKTYFHIFAN